MNCAPSSTAGSTADRCSKSVVRNSLNWLEADSVHTIDLLDDFLAEEGGWDLFFAAEVMTARPTSLSGHHISVVGSIGSGDDVIEVGLDLA